MKVFISWSGQKSKDVGDLLDDWLQCVIQAIEPWISTRGIDRGALWFSEITNQLNETTMGIICLTRENLNKPWILFEAGALAKGLQNNRICTFLIDIEPSDIQDPLAQFNHTLPTRDGLYSLVRTLNSSLGDKALKEKVLDQVFETYWEIFENRFIEIIKENPMDEQQEDIRTDNDMLKELLILTRTMDKRVSRLEISKQKDHLNNSIINIAASAGKYRPEPISKSGYKMIKADIENGVPRDETLEFLINDFNINITSAKSWYNKAFRELHKDKINNQDT